MGRLFWLLMYLTFVVSSHLLRMWMAQHGAAEIWGWDYGTFVWQINDWSWITYAGFRHPGLGVVMSPLVALQHVWSGAYLWVMPGVATATAWEPGESKKEEGKVKKCGRLIYLRGYREGTDEDRVRLLKEGLRFLGRAAAM